MVEGHGVHRVANRHKELLLHRKFVASSPNGRFVDGAKAISGKILTRIEAIGKNLFYFFGTGHTTVVVHIHFGMSGRFATFTPANAPAVKATTRLLLQDGLEIGAHLSAMTVEHGNLQQYDIWASKLGPDPLRPDADFERLWIACGVAGCRGGNTSIGAVLMDQKRVAGVGNIYRAEICFKARIHPSQPANTLGREKFELIWFHCVDLMRRGVLEGSILTLDPDHQQMNPDRRRYVYNQSRCLLCKGKVQSWDVKGRTCYGCFQCQEMIADGGGGGGGGGGTSSAAKQARKNKKKIMREAKDVVVFKSKCAPEARDETGGTQKRKRKTKTTKMKTKTKTKTKISNSTIVRPTKRQRSAAAAALDKIRAGEGRNVEHVALADEESLAVIAAAASKRRVSSRRTKRVLL